MQHSSSLVQRQIKLKSLINSYGCIVHTGAEKRGKAKGTCIKYLPEIVLDHLNGCNFSPYYYHVLRGINFSKQLLMITLV